MSRNLLFFMVFLLIAQQCFACAGSQYVVFSDYSRINFVHPRFKPALKFTEHLENPYKNPTAVSQKLIAEGRGLSDVGIHILVGFIVSGFSVTEQTEQQYAEQMKLINAQPENCRKNRDTLTFDKMKSC